MPSPEQSREQPYWQTDQQIGEIPLWGERYALRLRLHQSEEPFSRRDDLLPLSVTHGTRTYVRAKPYILTPDISLTVGFYPTPEPYGAVGEVTEAEWTGMRHDEIGEAQAWYYPSDKVIMLWECYFFDRYRRQDPNQDRALATLWEGYERTLVQQLPEAQHLVTTWEDTYDRSDWQFFLQRRGYQPFTPSLFTKAITRS